MSVQVSPLEDWTAELGGGRHRVLVKRDDLLPFPLAGNKFRKLTYEFQQIDAARHVIVTVGALHSNHCRTAAMLAARRSIPIQLVLHTNEPIGAPLNSHLGMLTALGADIDVVTPDQVRPAVDRVTSDVERRGRAPYVIEGGCHTLHGVRAYADAVRELGTQVESAPDLILLASGTGATQAGIIAGCAREGWSTRVLGISVAREQNRGTQAVREALGWVLRDRDCAVEFTDSYRAGGYGKTNDEIDQTVAWAWSRGLPVDPIYTGKALTALRDFVANREPSHEQTIVFWHTGGLFQAISHWAERRSEGAVLTLS